MEPKQIDKQADHLHPVGFHLHFEFGMSWSSSGKSRRFSYMAKHERSRDAHNAGGQCQARRSTRSRYPQVECSRRRSSSAPPPTLEAVPQVSKALPATPGQYRLGENEMPWTPLAFPESGDGEFADNSYDCVLQTQQVDDRERGKAVEMASLAAAMMTVDNGFEDQWWNRGTRQTTQAGDLISPASIPSSKRELNS